MNENKTNINWYPGHMAKAKRQIEEDLKLIDVVIEILDARIPISSQNPEIAKLINNKKRIIILNKGDLADENQNKLWIKYFNENGVNATVCNSNNGNGINETIKLIERIMEKDLKNSEIKGRIGRKIKVIVLGIPNVGKSSFINRIAKKSVTEVGNKPGVTKQKQWIRLNDKIELLDTPGVLWPKFESEEVGLNLAYTGTIKNEILPNLEIAMRLLITLYEQYLENLIDRYKLDKEEILQIMNNTKSSKENRAYSLMEVIAKKRGTLLSKEQIDYDRISNVILDDFKNGKIGKITLERKK